MNRRMTDRDIEIKERKLKAETIKLNNVIDVVINTLKQEPCDDAINRKVIKAEYSKDKTVCKYKAESEV